MQTATSPTPTRQRGDRVRGTLILQFGGYKNRRPTPATSLAMIETAVRRVDDAHHDAQPVIQWRAQEIVYERPPRAMQQLAKAIAETFGCMWFEEGSPRWYHYGGSSRLRAWSAMFVFEKTWAACDKFAHYELTKNQNPEPGARRTFVSRARAEWVARLCGELPEREIEQWVRQEWKLARSRARARNNGAKRIPPRSMSYEDVARWLDGVIESWQV